MKGTKIKIFASALLVLMLFQFAPRPAEAGIANTANQFLQFFMAIYQRIEEMYIKTASQKTANATDEMNWNDTMDRYATSTLKTMFAKWLNKTIGNEYSSGNKVKTTDEYGAERTTDSPYFVTDWADYLYKVPQDFADTYIKGEFLVNKLSGGKCRSGQAGSSYYEYLCDEAEKAIGALNVKTTLPEYFKDQINANPQEDLFSDGDLMAFNAYFQCGNNPYCTSQATETLFNQVTQQKKEIAEKEASGEGALPKKNDDYTIAVPGKLFEYSINDAISSGNTLILNAQSWDELKAALVSGGIYQIMDKALNGTYFQGLQGGFQEFQNKYIKSDFFLKYGIR